jgi:hypothetical protein
MFSAYRYYIDQKSEKAYRKRLEQWEGRNSLKLVTVPRVLVLDVGSLGTNCFTGNNSNRTSHWHGQSHCTDS